MAPPPGARGVFATKGAIGSMATYPGAGDVFDAVANGMGMGRAAQVIHAHGTEIRSVVEEALRGRGSVTISRLADMCTERGMGGEVGLALVCYSHRVLGVRAEEEVGQEQRVSLARLFKGGLV